MSKRDDDVVYVQLDKPLATATYLRDIAAYPPSGEQELVVKGRLYQLDKPWDDRPDHVKVMCLDFTDSTVSILFHEDLTKLSEDGVITFDEFCGCQVMGLIGTRQDGLGMDGPSLGNLGISLDGAPALCPEPMANAIAVDGIDGVILAAEVYMAFKALSE